MRKNKEWRRGIRGDESRRDNTLNAHCTATVTKELVTEICKKRDV